MIETIENFFIGFWNFVQSAVGVFINTISGIISFVTSIPQMYSIVYDVLLYLPTVVTTVISVTVTVFVIKLVVGRE